MGEGASAEGPDAGAGPIESRIRERRRVSGGDLNESWWLRLDDGREAFMKTRPGVSPEEYRSEAAGLRWLAQAGGLPTPEVIAVDDEHLVLQWIEPGRLSPAGEENLGRGLARTHRAGAPAFGIQDARGASFGSLRLSNEPLPDWPSFYARRRLQPLARMARERGRIPAGGLGVVEALCDRIDELCGPPEPPARLHGDLWAGNVLADSRGEPWLIDPSAFGGHREVDLAMLRLFGGPSERAFAAYEEAFPLAEGWRERIPLYQLAPLLVHAILFGGSYGQAAIGAASRYVD